VKLQLTVLLYFLPFMLQTDDKSVQKKSYRILEEMCASSSPDAKKVIVKQLGKIRKLFLDSVVTASASSTAVSLGDTGTLNCSNLMWTIH
jgi:hypothetical protein